MIYIRSLLGINLLILSLLLYLPSVMAVETNTVAPENAVTITGENITETDFNNLSENNTNLTSDDETLRFSLQHRLIKLLSNQVIAIKFEQLASKPVILLEKLKENFSDILAQHEKPLRIETDLNILLPAEAIAKIGELPPVSIKTNINEDGSGQSKLTFPSYQRTIPDEGSFDWKGAEGQFTFSNQFKDLTAEIDILGFGIMDDEFSLSFGKTTAKSNFDEELSPTTLDVTLSSITIKDGADSFNLADLVSSFVINKTKQGLDLFNFYLKIKHFDFNDAEFNLNIDNLVINSYSKDNNELIDYILETQLRKITLPQKLPKEISEISYEGNFALRHLDASSLLQFQNTFNEAEDDSVMFMMLLGKSMELAPKIIGNSPEIALTKLLINTPQGNLNGKISIVINGEKLTAEQIVAMDTAAMFNATEIDAEFNISQILLKLIIATQNYNESKAKTYPSEQILTEEQISELQTQAQSAADGIIYLIISQKFLVEQGDNYQVVVKLRDSKLLINGQEVPLDALAHFM